MYSFLLSSYHHQIFPQFPPHFLFWSEWKEKLWRLRLKVGDRFLWCWSLSFSIFLLFFIFCLCEMYGEEVWLTQLLALAALVVWERDTRRERERERERERWGITHAATNRRWRGGCGHLRKMRNSSTTFPPMAMAAGAQFQDLQVTVSSLWRCRFFQNPLMFHGFFFSPFFLSLFLSLSLP